MRTTKNKTDSDKPKFFNTSKENKKSNFNSDPDLEYVSVYRVKSNCWRKIYLNRKLLEAGGKNQAAQWGQQWTVCGRQSYGCHEHPPQGGGISQRVVSEVVSFMLPVNCQIY